MAKVLVIEDIIDSAKLAQKILINDGHVAFMAANGEEAIRLVAENNDFDLILMDLGLPDIDGQTLLGMMRRKYSLTQTPIVVVTAWPEAEAKNMAEAYGFDGYISKPYRVTQFKAVINKYI